jgi:uncharacterized membrane protein YgcG
MNNQIKKYSEEEITNLSNAIEEDDDSYNWLINNSCKELAAVRDVIVNNNSEAVDWLQKNKFKTLLAFLSALDNNNEAVTFLLENEGKEWAAVAGIVNGEDQALNWLLKNKYSHFATLSKTLAEFYKDNSGTSSGGMGGISGGGGSGGFGGFGGGSFGGGGFGGSW